jgi:hypothetical protein
MTTPIMQTTREQREREQRAQLVKQYGEDMVRAAEQFATQWGDSLIRGDPTRRDPPRGILA